MGPSRSTLRPTGSDGALHFRRSWGRHVLSSLSSPAPRGRSGARPPAHAGDERHHESRSNRRDLPVSAASLDRHRAVNPWDGRHVGICVIEPAGPSLAGVAAVYAAVGFRDDLVDDLRIVREMGGDVFVAVLDGRVVGASSFLPFTTSGWIGGVAVLPGEARRGIGQELTQAAKAALGGVGVESALLHATAMARPLYQRMGFRADGELVEMRGASEPVRDGNAAVAGLRAGRPGDLADVLRMDRAVTGEDRRRLFEGRWPSGGSVVDDGSVRGFSLRGSRGSAGVVIASDADTGQALVTASLATAEGQQRIGLPVEQSTLRRLLEQYGFREHLRVTRMRLGPAVQHRPDRLFSVFNLYWG